MMVAGQILALIWMKKNFRVAHVGDGLLRYVVVPDGQMRPLMDHCRDTTDGLSLASWTFRLAKVLSTRSMLW